MNKMICGTLLLMKYWLLTNIVFCNIDYLHVFFFQYLHPALVYILYIYKFCLEKNTQAKQINLYCFELCCYCSVYFTFWNFAELDFLIYGMIVLHQAAFLDFNSVIWRKHWQLVIRLLWKFSLDNAYSFYLKRTWFQQTYKILFYTFFVLVW